MTSLGSKGDTMLCETTTNTILPGAGSLREKLAGKRIRIAMVAVLFGAALIGARLIQLGLSRTDIVIEGVAIDAIQASRPPILDRHGLPLAIDIRVPSLFAEPRLIPDIEDTIDQLRSVLPDLNAGWLRDRLSPQRGFVWIKREMLPAQADQIMRLGLPGIDLIEESKRFYPSGAEIAHVIGTVNIDNQGMSGMERVLDERELAVLQSVGIARDATLAEERLSLDLRVQHALREELLAALERFRAIAAAGVLLDVRTGEVLALVSLPDFDPNRPATSLVSVSFNRVTNGVFELGSAFKTMTIAAALDSGAVKIGDMIDAREGVAFGRFLLDHGKHRIMSVSDVFRYSDNIGTIRIMQAMGKERLRRFLAVAGFDQMSELELPERARPRVPDEFSDVGAATASYGYGFAGTPMHLISAIAGLVNDGCMVSPTLFPRSEQDAQKLCRTIVSSQTSEQVRYLLRINALQGSGHQMNAIAAGYRVGGKTGTAEKILNGAYSKTKNITVFISAFPMEAPRYAMLVMLDEAQADGANSTREAGWNAAVVTGLVIDRVAPMLGIVPVPDFSLDVPSRLLFPSITANQPATRSQN